MTSKHYTNDRQKREEVINRIGHGTPVATFIIDRGHKESIIIPLDIIHDIETEKNEDNNDDDCSRDINNTDDNSSFL